MRNQHQPSSQVILRASRAKRTAPGNMRVNHGRAHVGMTQKLLNRTDASICFQEVRGKASAKFVTSDRFANPGSCTGFPDSPCTVLL